MKKRYFVKSVMVLSAMALAATASNAFAGIGIDSSAGATPALTFATELAGGVNFLMPVQGAIGMTYGAAVIPYVKFGCGLNFAAAPAMNINGVTLGTPLFGGNASAYLTDSFALPPAGTVPADVVNLTAINIPLTNGTGLTCSMNVYDSDLAYAANNPSVTKSGVVAKWGTGLVLGPDDASCLTGTCNPFAIIDLSSGSMKFVGGATTAMIASVHANALTTVPVVNNFGVPVFWTGIGGMVDTSASSNTKLEVSGDFSAASQVWLVPQGGGTCAGADAYTAAQAGTLNADKTMVTFKGTQMVFGVINGLGTTTSIGATNPGGNICMTVNGTTEMNVSDYKATISLSPGAGYVVPASKDLGNVGRVVDNGSSSLVNLVLAPNGYFAGFLRINHEGSQAGNISLRLINDDGVFTTIDLADVAGQTTSTLAGLASTTQMPIADIYAAAQTKDPSFAVTGDGKLRIIARSDSTVPFSVNAQVYALSRDGVNFVVIQE